MNIDRREFIQITGTTAAGLAISGCAGMDDFVSPVNSYARKLKTRNAKETPTICCYCAVGCGAIVHTSKNDDKRVINM